VSQTAVQHAVDGYSRRGNFGGSPVCNMVLIYPPDGTKMRFYFKKITKKIKNNNNKIIKR